MGKQTYHIEEPLHGEMRLPRRVISYAFEPGDVTPSGDDAIALKRLEAQGIVKRAPKKVDKPATPPAAEQEG